MPHSRICKKGDVRSDARRWMSRCSVLPTSCGVKRGRCRRRGPGIHIEVAGLARLLAGCRRAESCRLVPNLTPRGATIHEQVVEAADGVARLDPGERHAIQLAKREHADLQIMDERLGVRIAREEGLAVTGTLGILLQAARCRLVDVEKALIDLQNTDLRCSRVMDEVRRLGARPSKWYANHFASFCAHPTHVGASIGALGERDTGVSRGEIGGPHGRVGGPISGTGDTSSRCYASCTPATIRLGPSPIPARETAGSHAPV